MATDGRGSDDDALMREAVLQEGRMPIPQDAVVLRPLKPRERQFVEAYLRTGQAGKAAAAAGYTRSAAAQLMERPQIVAALRSLAVRTAPQVTKDYVVGKLTAALDEGIPNERIRAAAELGKLMGYYAPTRVKHEGAKAPGEGLYADLRQTLLDHADRFTEQERAALRRQIQEDIADAQSCLALLSQPVEEGVPPGGGGRRRLAGGRAAPGPGGPVEAHETATGAGAGEE